MRFPSVNKDFAKAAIIGGALFACGYLANDSVADIQYKTAERYFQNKLAGQVTTEIVTLRRDNTEAFICTRNEYQARVGYEQDNGSSLLLATIACLKKGYKRPSPK